MLKIRDGGIKILEIQLMHGDDYYVHLKIERVAVCLSGLLQENQIIMQIRSVGKLNPVLICKTRRMLK